MTTSSSIEALPESRRPSETVPILLRTAHLLSSFYKSPLLIKYTCLASEEIYWRKLLLLILHLADVAAKEAKEKVSSRDEDKEGQ